MLSKSSISMTSALRLHNRLFATISIKHAAKVQEAPSVAEKVAASATSTPDVDNIHHPRYHEKYTFAKDFLSNSKSIYSFPEGGFQEVSTVDLDKYLPEGLSHAVDDALDSKNSNNKSYWMIRESSKLLCRLVDEVQSTLVPAADKKSPNEIIHKRSVHIPQLTDREEWADNVLQVTRYGNHLVNTVKAPLQGKVNYVHVTKQSDCVVDTCISRIYEEMSEETKKTKKTLTFPTKILLTGDRGSGKSTVLSQAILHARKQNWLTVFIPRSYEQTCEGSYIETPTVPLPHQHVSDGDADLFTSMYPLNHPSPLNPLYNTTLSNRNTSATYEDLVFDNVFQSASALRGLYQAHAADLRKIPISYSNSNNNTAHYVRLYTKLHNAAPTNPNPSYTSIDAFQLIRAQFLESQQKIITASGKHQMNYIQLRALVEGEDNFPEQDALDSDILLSSGPAPFDMTKFQFKTLEDLVLFGIAVRSCAGSVFMHLMTELRNTTAQPVLIAVDQYNVFEAPSAYQWNKRVVLGKQLCVANAVYAISKKRAQTDAYEVKHGMVICSTSATHEEGYQEQYKDAVKSIPLCIRVPGFNQVEYFAMMRYYAASSSRLSDFIPISQLLSYRMLCSSNPYEMRLNSFLYFTTVGLNNDMDIDNFQYLASDTRTDVPAEEKQARLMDLQQKFQSFKKNFKAEN